MACQDAIIAACECAWKVVIIARVIGVDWQDEIWLRILFDGPAVEENLTLPQFNSVAGQSDNSLDPILIFALRCQDNNVTAFGHFSPNAGVAFRQRDGQRLHFFAQDQPAKNCRRIGNGG